MPVSLIQLGKGFGFVVLSGLAILVFVVLDAPMVYHRTPDVLALSNERELQPRIDPPAELIIPRLGVEAVVEYVGFAEESPNEMAAPSNVTDVSWYKYGPTPGMPGSAVMAGHLNGKNVPKAVFYDLHTLVQGDTVEVVTTKGDTLVFVVTAVRTYAHDAPADDVFLSNDDTVRLNLITCAGDWLGEDDVYSHRTVVFTELRTP